MTERYDVSRRIAASNSVKEQTIVGIGNFSMSLTRFTYYKAISYGFVSPPPLAEKNRSFTFKAISAYGGTVSSLLSRLIF